MIVKRMFSRAWLLTTLLALAGAALCIRLGIWQLDRLEQRRVFNQHVLEVRAMPPLEINGLTETPLQEMEYRAIYASGTYDFSQQVALRNQYHRDQFGYHLITPLVLADGSAILIDRGWIPAEGNDSPADWRKYNQPGVVEVTGIVRLSREKNDLGQNLDAIFGDENPRLDFWYLVNLPRLQSQMSQTLLPVYLQLDVSAGDETPPVPFQPEVKITEGSHQGYALQWFTFAAILFFGYPFYIKNQQEEQVRA